MKKLYVSILMAVLISGCMPNLYTLSDQEKIKATITLTDSTTKHVTLVDANAKELIVIPDDSTGFRPPTWLKTTNGSYVPYGTAGGITSLGKGQSAILKSKILSVKDEIGKDVTKQYVPDPMTMIEYASVENAEATQGIYQVVVTSIAISLSGGDCPSFSGDSYGDAGLLVY